MLSLFLIQTFAAMLVLVNTNTASLAESRSWLTSCKPCKDVLDECSDCIGPNCIQCISEIDSSLCGKCGEEIASTVNSTLNCDNNIEYHKLVCRIRCRSSVLYTHGECDANTAVCTCLSVNPTTTTTTQRTPSLFPVHFDHNLARQWGFSLKERVVNLTGMNIGSIENTLFQDFIYMDTLILRNNKLLRFYPETFRNCRYLTYLDLSFNGLSSIMKTDLIGAESIGTIKLNNNRLNYIEANTFENFNQLTNYDFSNNEISTLFTITLNPNGILNFIRN